MVADHNNYFCKTHFNNYIIITDIIEKKCNSADSQQLNFSKYACVTFWVTTSWCVVGHGRCFRELP